MHDFEERWRHSDIRVHEHQDIALSHTFPTLVLNTTTPQKLAIGLYRKLEFREGARTFIDRYEMVWLRLDL